MAASVFSNKQNSSFYWFSFKLKFPKKLNILRTCKPQKWRKFKKNDPQTKFTGSYKKDCISFVNNK